MAPAAGETVRVRFTIPAAALGFHGADLRFRVEPGDVTFLVGPTETTVTMTGDVEHPDPNAAQPFTATRRMIGRTSRLGWLGPWRTWFVATTRSFGPSSAITPPVFVFRS